MMLAKEMLLPFLEKESGWIGTVYLRDPPIGSSKLMLRDLSTFGNVPEISSISMSLRNGKLFAYNNAIPSVVLGRYYRKDTGSLYIVDGSSSSDTYPVISGPWLFSESEIGKKVTVYWKPL